MKKLTSIFKLLTVMLFAGGLLFISSCGKDDPKPTYNNNNNNQQSQNFYRLYNLESGQYLTTNQPHQVNMLFQVLDKDYKGVPGLTKDKFEILENSSPLSSEAKPVIDTFGAIPFEIKTVLLLDISSSVEGMVSQIKQAAIEMVNSKSPEQAIAVYTFDSKSKKIQDFSTSKNLLISAINSIPESGLVSSTNIYGSLIDVAGLYQDSYKLSKITQGSIILFTDGKETTESKTLTQAQYAVDNKKIFVLGLKSSDLDETNLKALSTDGTIVYANNISEVKEKFLEIQRDIIKLSKSVYWLYYQSPKRGSNTHTLKINVKDNTNTDYTNGSASGTYSSSNFTD
jgi:uncharacterized protein YegL